MSNEDGIFVFEAETLYAVPEQGVWHRSVWQDPAKTKDQKIILSQRTTLQNDICTSLCKYELMEAGNIIHTEIEELNVKIYEQDQLIEMLKSTGFKHIRTLKTFDQSSEPSKQDESIVYECRK